MLTSSFKRGDKSADLMLDAIDLIMCDGCGGSFTRYMLLQWPKGGGHVVGRRKREASGRIPRVYSPARASSQHAMPDAGHHLIPSSLPSATYDSTAR